MSEEQAKTLSYNTLKNSLYSFFGYTFPIIFSIAITPIVVKKLGAAEFGIYILVLTIMGFLNLADLGLGMALMKYGAEYYAQKETQKLQRLISSANSIFYLFGFFGLIFFVVIGKYFLPLFHIGRQSSSNIFWVFLFGGLIFFLNAISTIPSYMPKALQRYDISVKISLAQLTVLNISMLVLAILGFQLKAILLANVIITFFAFLVYKKIFSKLLPQIKISFGWDGLEIKRSYKFGIAAFLTNISNNTLAQLDRLVIPMYLSTAQLSFYSLPGNVAEKINGVTGSTTSVLFPMMSSLSASENKERISSIYNKIFRNIFVISAAMALPVAFLAYKILYFWLGKEFADQGAKILIILAATNFFLSIYSVLQNFLLGLGKVKFLTKASIFMASLNVVSLLILVPKYGILGAAWAYLISVFPIIFYFYWVEKKYIQLAGRMKFYAKLLAKLVITAVAGYLLIHYAIDPLIKNLLSLVILGPVSVICMLAIYKVFGFLEEEDWEVYKNFALSIKYKIF